jgi:hypothetical protein
MYSLQPSEITKLSTHSNLKPCRILNLLPSAVNRRFLISGTAWAAKQIPFIKLRPGASWDENTDRTSFLQLDDGQPMRSVLHQFSVFEHWRRFNLTSPVPSSLRRLSGATGQRLQAGHMLKLDPDCFLGTVLNCPRPFRRYPGFGQPRSFDRISHSRSVAMGY